MMSLENLALPVSGSHLSLLSFLLMLAQISFYIYTGIVFGSMILSYLFKRDYNKTGNELDNKFSQDIISVITTNPTTWFGFGLMPMLAIIIMYIQMAGGQALNSVNILMISFLFYAVGITVIYFYKNSLHYQMLYSLFNKRKAIVKDEFSEGLAEEQNKQMGILNRSTGFWGITFMLFAVWIFSTGTQYAVDESMWGDSAVQNMLTLSVFFKVTQFIIAGISMAGATYIFLRYYWDGGYDFKDENYAEYARKKATGWTLVTLVIQPLLMAFTIGYAPKSTVSAMVYLGVALAIVFSFIGSHMVFTYLRSNTTNLLKYAFALVLAAFTFFAVSQQQNFTEANSQYMALRVHEYEMLELARAAEKSGPVEIDGSEIYKTRCSACHQFDVAQVTAPAYKDVVPKYDGKMDALVEFILNPQPRGNIDPNGNKYPPMANQGLNKREAEAIAKYLVEKLNGGGEEKKEETPAAEANDDTKDAALN